MASFAVESLMKAMRKVECSGRFYFLCSRKKCWLLDGLCFIWRQAVSPSPEDLDAKKSSIRVQLTTEITQVDDTLSQQYIKSPLALFQQHFDITVRIF